MDLVNSKHMMLYPSPISAPVLSSSEHSSNSSDQSLLSAVQQSDFIPIRPVIALGIGILAIILSFGFLVCLYTRLCNGSTMQMFADQSMPQSSKANVKSKTARIVEFVPVFGEGSTECAVCLSSLRDMELLRLLPDCGHIFHRECIRKWLALHFTCPICRLEVDPEDVVLTKNIRLFSNQGI
uniref:RING-type domain-containing protein n=1 Tax=Nymphaea colorata TaxID=210225 RepID=A0A5K1GVF3_9MAGN